MNAWKPFVDGQEFQDKRNVKWVRRGTDARIEKNQNCFVFPYSFLFFSLSLSFSFFLSLFSRLSSDQSKIQSKWTISSPPSTDTATATLQPLTSHLVLSSHHSTIPFQVCLSFLSSILSLFPLFHSFFLSTFLTSRRKYENKDIELRITSVWTTLWLTLTKPQSWFKFGIQILSKFSNLSPSLSLFLPRPYSLFSLKWLIKRKTSEKLGT